MAKVGSPQAIPASQFVHGPLYQVDRLPPDNVLEPQDRLFAGQRQVLWSGTLHRVLAIVRRSCGNGLFDCTANTPDRVAIA